MRTLPQAFSAYAWAPSTGELATRLGLDPVEIVRFDGNVPAWPLRSSRPGALAAALADVENYPHGGYAELTAAVARYAGVEPENVVLGAEPWPLPGARGRTRRQISKLQSEFGFALDIDATRFDQVGDATRHGCVGAAFDGDRQPPEGASPLTVDYRWGE